jgi:hypothetical protein
MRGVGQTEYARRWRERNPERSRLASRNYYARRVAADPGFREKLNNRRKDNYAKQVERDPSTVRRSNLSRYGMTLEDYDARLAAQGGRCAICGALEPGSNRSDKFFVDHDHATGAVRGLLCSHCNRGLGGFRDDLTLLDKARAYLVGSA